MKWSYPHPVKSLNKRKVLDLIEKNWTSGFKQNDIIEKTKLTKPTVYHILNELLSEHKIFKLNNIYYPEFDDDFAFSYFISDYINFFLTNLMEKKETITNLMYTVHSSNLILAIK